MSHSYGTKRSKRSMRGQDPDSQQEGNGSRTASSAVHPPPIHALFSLFSCPDKISQQSHQCRLYHDRKSFVNFHKYTSLSRSQPYPMTDNSNLPTAIERNK